MKKMSFEKDAILYLDDFKQSLEQIENLVLKMTKESNIKDSVNQIQRILHSLKGTAGSYGFDLLSLVCHRVEDLLLTLEYNDIQYIIDNLLGFLDTLNSIAISYKTENFNAIQNYQQQYGIIHHKEVKDGALLKLKKTKEQLKALGDDRKFRVLIAENSKILSNTLLKSLSSFEVEISIARDGYEALGRLLKENFDLIFCSLQLPVIDSTTLFKILELKPNNNTYIKTILLTSSKSHATLLKKENLHIVEKNSQLEYEIESILKNFLPLKISKNETHKSIPLSILLIDDSEDIHRLVEFSLKKHPNISLSCCTDSKNAELMILEKKPNIILLDVQMPQISGDELFKKLVEKKIINKSSVIFLTATDNESELSLIKGLDAAGIIRKPFATKLLMQYIEEIVLLTYPKAS